MDSHFFLQRVEQQQREDAEAGAMITVKRKKAKGKSSGRQTKLTSGGAQGSNSIKITKPSPFAEAIDPSIPEFNAEPKKAGSRGKGKGKDAVKMEKTETDSPEKSPKKAAAPRQMPTRKKVSEKQPSVASMSFTNAALQEASTIIIVLY